MIIVNLTRASKGMFGQPIRTSFAGKWKEASSLLVD